MKLEISNCSEIINGYCFKTCWLYRFMVLGFKYEINNDFTNKIYIYNK